MNRDSYSAAKAVLASARAVVVGNVAEADVAALRDSLVELDEANRLERESEADGRPAYQAEEDRRADAKWKSWIEAGRIPLIADAAGMAALEWTVIRTALLSPDVHTRLLAFVALHLGEISDERIGSAIEDGSVRIADAAAAPEEPEE